MKFSVRSAVFRKSMGLAVGFEIVKTVDYTYILTLSNKTNIFW